MVKITVVVLEGAYSTSVAITVDMLRAAAVISSQLKVNAPTWRVVSVTGGDVKLQNGFALKSSKISARSAGDEALWIFPGLGISGPRELDERLAQDDVTRILPLLRRHVARGGRVAASCSAVFLLAKAGLLDSRRVTTSWWLTPHLSTLAPACTVDVNQMVCADDWLITAGAAHAQTDLMLHLLKDLGGTRLVNLVKRYLLVDARSAQSPYIDPALMSSSDKLIGKLTARIEQSMPNVPSIAELASEMALSERTLARRVNQSIGKSPSELVQSIRLKKARELLQSSPMKVEQVALAVGYQDATALRRSMKKLMGAKPAQFRTNSF